MVEYRNINKGQQDQKPTEFKDLLAQLNRQHELDVAAASNAMQEKNMQLRNEVRRLTQEIKQVRSSKKRVVIEGPRDAAHYIEAPPLPTLPTLVGSESYATLTTLVDDCTSSPSPSLSKQLEYFDPPLPGRVATFSAFSLAREHDEYIDDGNSVSIVAFETSPQQLRTRNDTVERNLAMPEIASHTEMTKEIQDNERKNDLRRFKKIMNLREMAPLARLTFTDEDLKKVLDVRGKKLTPEQIKEVMKILQAAADIRFPKQSRIEDHFKEFPSLKRGGRSPARKASKGKAADTNSTMLLTTLVDLLLLPDLKNIVHEKFRHTITDIKNTLMNPHTSEVYRFSNRDSATESGFFFGKEQSNDSVAYAKFIMPPLNFAVFISIWMSLLTLGFSLDNDPEGVQWTILESLFCIVFISEVVIKNALFGSRQYFCGEDKYFNWLDIFLTGVSTCDVLFTITFGSSSQDKKTFSNSRLAFVLRVLRLARLGRLTKLLRYPVFKDMLNMLAGLMLGIPSLLWVLILLLFIVYIVGIIFRQIVGPKYGDPNLVELCGGSADDLSDADLLVDPHCKRYKIYGEEYFGSVTMSMFTTFRCMIGDCNTKGGISLVVTFSDSYGTKFDCTYAICMIIVIFGLFNTITSVFVEATLSGLKYNDDKRRYQRNFAAQYTNTKLQALEIRLDELKDRFEEKLDTNGLSDILLTESDFAFVMQDEKVGSLLDDLDIPSFNRPGLFELFDVDGTGEVSIPNFLSTLMRLRGEPQKSDAVATWVTLCAVRDRLEDFKKVLLENQKLILHQQEKLIGNIENKC